MLPLLATLLKNEEEQIFRLKDWKNGIIINRGNLGQGWIKPSDTDEGQIFTVVCARMCTRKRAGMRTCTVMFGHGWLWNISICSRSSTWPELVCTGGEKTKQPPPEKKKKPTGVLVVQSDNLSVSKVACGLWCFLNGFSITWGCAYNKAPHDGTMWQMWMPDRKGKLSLS